MKIELINRAIWIKKADQALMNILIARAADEVACVTAWRAKKGWFGRDLKRQNKTPTSWEAFELGFSYPSEKGWRSKTLIEEFKQVLLDRDTGCIYATQEQVLAILNWLELDENET